jgi:hypothetical protein
MNTMKLRNFFPVIVTLLIVLIAGCQKDELLQDPDLSLKKAVRPPPVVVVKPVNLGLAGSFVILSKSGITDVFPSVITGDVGSSPITGAAILLTCPEVTGTIYTVNSAGPLPCRVKNPLRLTLAVLNMQTAYVDAAGRATSTNTLTQVYTNLGAGNIGGKTLTPGVYKWTTGLNIPTDITISGKATDVWIFRVAGTLTMSSAVKITLSGGALAKNIFWQVAGAVTLGTTSHFEGIILGKTGINLQTGASINGRLLAQTAVTLQKSTVKKP